WRGNAPPPGSSTLPFPPSGRGASARCKRSARRTSSGYSAKPCPSASISPREHHRGMNRLHLCRIALRSKSPTPLGAFVRGLAAGALGAAAQSLFFMATRRWAPTPTRLPRQLRTPEQKAQSESSVETVARRTVEGLMKRGPLEDADKARAGSAVHYLFGAAWGEIGRAHV